MDRARSDWIEFEAPLIDATPPDSWSPYRWMWGNNTYLPEDDPNPFRLVLNAIVSLETDLIRHWLMSPEPFLIDLAWEAGQYLQRHELSCTDPEDLSYLGVLVASHGWVEEFHSLFRQALSRYSHWQKGDGAWHFQVDLKPLEPSQRQLFSKLEPGSPGVWRSRLTTGPGPGPDEGKVVAELRESLRRSPPRFTFVETRSPTDRIVRRLH